MAIKVLVPRLGEGVEEVTIIKWLKNVGDQVNELEPLLEVNTDKVDTEIPAPATGVVLSIDLAEGLAARVGQVLAVIGQPGEIMSEAEPSPSQSSALQAETRRQAQAPALVTPSEQSNELGFISPVVARIATEFGVDLRQVTGTGLGNRITKADVVEYLKRGSQAPRDTRQPVAEQPRLPASPSPSSSPTPGAPGDRLVKHSLMRKTIAEHMLASKHTSPHVLTVMEVDMSRVALHRSTNKAAFERDGINLTYTAYFLAALAAGLKTNPLANSSWTEEGVLIHGGIHLGMATSLGEEGLIVPVIKNADGLSLTGLARAANDLAARARAKKLLPDEVKGGTFTLTNHGVSGSLFAMPIINQPQCGILGVGALQKRAVVISDTAGNDAISIRPMVYLSFVFDHRILDGASADQFLTRVKEYLEKWEIK